MIVAMSIMDVMQMPVHQIVDVVAMGDGFVATARTMFVGLVVAAAVVSGCASCRVLAADCQAVFLDTLGAHVMQVSVMQIVGMAIVLDGRVPAGGTVLMIVFCVKGSCHGGPPSCEKFRHPKGRFTVDYYIPG